MGKLFLNERDRWVLWLPVGVGSGICLYFWLPSEPSLWLIFSLNMLAVTGFWLSGKADRQKQYATAFLSLALLSAGLGMASAKVRTLSAAATVLQKEIGPTTVSGRIEAIETFPKGLRVILSAPQISGLQPHLAPDKIRIRLKGAQPEIWPGDWIRVRAKLSPPSPPVSPGAFDFQRQAFFRGIGAIGFGLGRAKVTALAKDTNGQGISYQIARLRFKITQRIIMALPGPHGGLAAALMTGEKRAVDEKTVQNLRDTGLAHLLSISGLHVGLVAGIIFTGLRFLLALFPYIGLRFPIKKWAAIAALAGAFAYALIAGATLPTMRAFLMLAIALIAVVFDRRGISMRSLAWAALVVLIVQPENLFGPSFQMSFAAVMALIAAYEVITSRHQKQPDKHSHLPGWLKTMLLYIAGVALTTLVAGLQRHLFQPFILTVLQIMGLWQTCLPFPLPLSGSCRGRSSPLP